MPGSKLSLGGEVEVQAHAVNDAAIELLSYLKATLRWLRKLLNFSVPVLKDGIVRIIN